MINLALKPLGNSEYQKNKLYKITHSCTVCFREEHEHQNEIVDIVFMVDDKQYGIFANEYKRPDTLKEGNKSTDVLACAVDERTKTVFTTIFDVKSNISAFSDDLYKDEAMITALKEVRDFIQQIRAEILHKNSFMLYFLDEGYREIEEVGIVTKSFEKEKFLSVANLLESMFVKSDQQIPQLVDLKLKNILAPYKYQIEQLRNFAEKEIDINGKRYLLKVYILKKINDIDYYARVNVSCNNGDVMEAC